MIFPRLSWGMDPGNDAPVPTQMKTPPEGGVSIGVTSGYCSVELATAGGVEPPLAAAFGGSLLAVAVGSAVATLGSSGVAGGAEGDGLAIGSTLFNGAGTAALAIVDLGVSVLVSAFAAGAGSLLVRLALIVRASFRGADFAAFASSRAGAGAGAVLRLGAGVATGPASASLIELSPAAPALARLAAGSALIACGFAGTCVVLGVSSVVRSSTIAPPITTAVITPRPRPN
jgi:hypothetical protein